MAVFLLSGLGGLVVAANAPELQVLRLGGGTAIFLLLAIGWGGILARAVGTTLAIEIQALLGVALMAHALALPAMLLGLPILWTAALLPLGLVGLAFLDRTVERESEGGLALVLALLAAAGFASIWSLESSARYQEFLAGGPFRLWPDAFIHAGTIAEFGDPRTIGRGSSAMVDVPSALYHAVSHVIAGLAVRLAGIGPLDVIPALWFPFGIFLTALGVFALGRAIAGLAGGCLALFLLALLPDTAAYGLRQGFLSFHWMMETSPGSLYALPVALGSISLLVRWTQEGGAGRLALSLLLLGATFLLRAHIFVWLLVPFAVTLWFALPWPSRRVKWAFLLLGSLAAPLALFAIAHGEISQIGRVSFLTRYIEGLHGDHSPTGYDHLYPWLIGLLGRLGALPFGLALALLGMAGVWLGTFLLGAVLAARRGLLRTADAFPFALLVWATGLMALAPTPFHGDFTDFRQRAFVLVYVILLAWTVRFALLLWPRLMRPVPAALAACLALPATMLWMPTAKLPRMAWGAHFANTQIRPGLIDTARWIRDQAQGGESFAIGVQKADELLFDDATVILGVSGVPAYLSRPGIMRLSGPPRSDMAAQRLSRLAEMQAEADASAAFALLRAERVGFYVLPRASMPTWDPEGLLAEFRSGEMVVWRVGSLSGIR